MQSRDTLGIIPGVFFPLGDFVVDMKHLLLIICLLHYNNNIFFHYGAAASDYYLRGGYGFIASVGSRKN